MINHINPNFLKDSKVCSQAEEYWIKLWNEISHKAISDDWIYPWFQPLPPHISQGNPIFSAFSSNSNRGIRILQFEPTKNELEFFHYYDNFGAVNELVISCAASDEAEKMCVLVISFWISKKFPFGQLMFANYGAGV
jgi:hypothetical protein